MHQILSLRPFFNQKKNQWDKTDSRDFGKWNAPSLQDLFTNIDKYIEQIPEHERWNLYYTVANCGEGKRQFAKQDVMVFDIDGINTADLEPYIKVVCSGLGVDREQIGLVASGNGLHFIIGLKTPIEEATYFDANRRHYHAILAKLKAALQKENLPGEPDPAVFDPRRIMRLPNTLNKKDGKPDKQCTMLNAAIVPMDFDITKLSGLPEVEAKDQINTATLKRFPTPDTEAVLEGCEFLKWTKERPNDVSEQQWYGMLSIVPRLPPNGRDLAHEYSKGHSSYSVGECEAKIDQALQASGPRTCANIDGLWGKCAGCKFNGKVTSPIMIQGEKYIKTATTGFHEVVVDKGVPRTGKPNFEDLRRFFEKENPYVVLAGSGLCLVWRETHWEPLEDLMLQNFAQMHFNPTADTRMTQEFKSLVCRTNIKPSWWFTESVKRKINFKNGVLDLDTMELIDHSIEFGFRYVLPYDYDANAKAPVFEKFLKDITNDRHDLADTLIQFAGYAISNDSCWATKALIMTGEGANGKSTLIKVLQQLVGSDNFSSLTMLELKSPTARKLLDGKLFNISEETPTQALTDSALFKNLIGGGDMTVKMLYKQEYSIVNRAKFMFACNTLPPTKDVSKGFFRRLIIVPFDVEFEGDKVDHLIDNKLAAELPGIFNVIVDGYFRLQEAKRFPSSAVINDTIEDYRNDHDNVKVWFDSCLVLNPLAAATEESAALVSKLYASYRAYAEEIGDRPENQATVCRRLRRLMPDYEKRKFRKIDKGRKEIAYLGVRFSDGSQY